MPSENYSTTYPYAVSCGIGGSDVMANQGPCRNGRARAAVEAEAIRATLQTLAAEIPLNDFTWLRVAVDAAFDELLFGSARD